MARVPVRSAALRRLVRGARHRRAGPGGTGDRRGVPRRLRGHARRSRHSRAASTPLAAPSTHSSHTRPTREPIVRAVSTASSAAQRARPKQKAPTRTKIIGRLMKQLHDGPKDVRDSGSAPHQVRRGVSADGLVAPLDVAEHHPDQRLRVAVLARRIRPENTATSSVSPTAPPPRHVPFHTWHRIARGQLIKPKAPHISA